VKLQGPEPPEKLEVEHPAGTFVLCVHTAS